MVVELYRLDYLVMATLAGPFSRRWMIDGTAVIRKHIVAIDEDGLVYVQARNL